MIKNKTTDEQFKKWLEESEGMNLEFKKAENSFSKTKNLPDYCAAIANEGGGKLILGVDNNKNMFGTSAFLGTSDGLSHYLLQNLGIRVDVEEKIYQEKRAIIFHIPARPVGRIVRSTGEYNYPMRAGSSLVEMNQDKIKEILNETEPDFSCQNVKNFSLADIDEEAIDNFKKIWAKKQNKKDYLTFSMEKTLKSIGAMDDEGLNNAALILFGKKRKIDQLLPCAEIIFEWRQVSKIRHDFRKDWREPFFKIYDEIWEVINARNLRFPYHEGFIQKEVVAFNEESIREAIANAIAHRDYNVQSSSIFIKATSEKFSIKSPGGFVNGVNADNILEKSEWRNRRIAEIFQLAGLVERSGQGMDIIFGNTIQEGKGLPDFLGTDNYSVTLNIPATVKDKEFIMFLERIINQRQIALSFEEILELEKIREEKKVKDIDFKDKFIKLGIVEKVGKTSGSQYVLSHRYYSFKNKLGLYTRIVGISRDEKKQLILTHLKKNERGFARDLKDAFPDLKPKDVSNLLQELKKEGKIKHKGSDRGGYWILLNK
ncbi:MAG: transcriptional regulator [Parcubacteria group bacterium Athens0714_25]|nr:MAG: transcriptional regulator [Parcubacteria group bacterium Athens0714_25]